MLIRVIRVFFRYSYDNNRYHLICGDWCGSSHRFYKRIVGLLAAKALYVSVAERVFSKITDSMTFAQILAFVVIWIVVPLLFLLVAALLTKAMEAVSLGWLNRWLGAGLGALKFLLLVSLLICVVEFIDSDNTMIDRTMKEESVLYYPKESFAGMFFPAAKEVTEQYILNT